MYVGLIDRAGADRGPILEVIVSRMHYIAEQTDAQLRLVGLSTALANASDLGAWLCIKQAGLFNFRPSVRPVPLEAHIQAFPGKHYCPRMATMNKVCHSVLPPLMHYPSITSRLQPTFSAIKQHSPEKPVLVFVASRRQTRLTAMAMIGFCASDENPYRFLHMPQVGVVLNQVFLGLAIVSHKQEEMEMLIQRVHDTSLAHCLVRMLLWRSRIG